MYRQYDDSFGNEIWLWQNRQQCKLWIGFCQYHTLRVRIECHQKQYDAELMEIMDSCRYVRDDERLTEVPILNHFRTDDTYSIMSKRLEKLFEIIPEIQTINSINEI